MLHVGQTINMPLSVEISSPSSNLGSISIFFATSLAAFRPSLIKQTDMIVQAAVKPKANESHNMLVLLV
jgi:hypothetical protein